MAYFNHRIIASALLPVLLSAPAAHAEEALELRQTHRYFSDSKVVICDRGLRVSFLNFDYELMSLPDDYVVYVFSEKRKVVNTTPFNIWLQLGMYGMFKTKRAAQMKVGERREVKLYGMPGRRITFLNDLKSGKVGRTVVTYGNSTKARARLNRVLQRLWGLPLGNGIPLAMSKDGQPQAFGFGLAYNKVYEHYEVLSTKSLKNTTIDPKLLVMPRGLKEVDIQSVTHREKDVIDTFSDLLTD